MTNKAIQILADVLRIKPEKLSTSSTADEFTQWDSLALMQLMVKLESTYGLKLSIRDVTLLKSVQGLSELIARCDD